MSAAILIPLHFLSGLEPTTAFVAVFGVEPYASIQKWTIRGEIMFYPNCAVFKCRGGVLDGRPGFWRVSKRGAIMSGYPEYWF